MPVSPDAPLPTYRPYALEMRRPPRLGHSADAWRRAIEVVDGPAPSDERRFIHRDYHPGNVLWARGRVSGVIDWVNASIGAPEADVGHCRVNLAGRFGQPAADRFLDLYRAISGPRQLPSLLGHRRRHRRPGRVLGRAADPEDERFLAIAVAAL